MAVTGKIRLDSLGATAPSSSAAPGIRLDRGHHVTERLRLGRQLGTGLVKELGGRGGRVNALGSASASSSGVKNFVLAIMATTKTTARPPPIRRFRVFLRCGLGINTLLTHSDTAPVLMSAGVTGLCKNLQ